MPGELLDIGKRPTLVASFDPPRAAEEFERWRAANAEALDGVPTAAMRVEYGRLGDGLFIRVRIDEGHVPEGLERPGAAAGLPPVSA